MYHWEESQSNARWSATTHFPCPHLRLQEQCSGDVLPKHVLVKHVLVKQVTSNKDTNKSKWGVFHWTHEAKFVQSAERSADDHATLDLELDLEFDLDPALLSSTLVDHPNSVDN